MVSAGTPSLKRSQYTHDVRHDGARGRRDALPGGLLALLLAVAVAIGPAAAQPAADGGATTDDEFIESLGSTRATHPVDRRRLAKVLFSLAATLDGDKSTVRLLQSQVVVNESSGRAVRSLLDARYENYLDGLAAFRSEVSALLDQPESLLLLYNVLSAGQRACWQLDLHNLLVDTYASGRANTLPVLSSREACSRLRTVVFQPRVEAIIRDALVERVYQQERIRRLEQDLRDLEDLLADLKEIDGS